ncbi:hypothetical protein [Vibrio brasiliensis]|uniref:hypothetical protein n=1 Tax=Vibrio brasiliensis TaxID=170652 RepID=UPI001EFCB1B8|nr:hypothetical protein [Vibrio brasiliensis]
MSRQIALQTGGNKESFFDEFMRINSRQFVTVRSRNDQDVTQFVHVDDFPSD